MSAAAPPTPLPLAGIRILELANVVAGPSIGAHLSDFGAEVIKIERPGEGDAARAMGEAVGERSAWWLCLGRNKRTVALDLKRDGDRERFLELAAEADAVVESFRPGVLERLGLAPERLREVNPGLVLVRISAFGQTGPYAGRPGFGTLAEAFSGLAEISGYPDRPPLLPPIALADQAAGLFGTWALLAALYHRDVHEGPGQTIDVSLYEAVLSLLGPLPTLYRHNGTLLQRRGSRLSFSSPRNVYRTRDDRHFAISGTAPSAAERVVRIVGGQALVADPRFATPAARAEHADELDLIVAEWIAARDLAEVEARFEEANAAGIAVMDMADAAADPHYAARKTVVPVPDPELGQVYMTAPVPRMSATPGRISHPGQGLGAEHGEALGEPGGTAMADKPGAAIVGAWHTGFQVADLDRSLSFYRDLLGLEQVWRRVVTDEYIGTLVGYPGLQLHQALLRIPGTEHHLELLDYRNVERTVVDTRTANPGTAHICLLVRGLARMYDRLLDAGVTFISPPVTPTVGPNKGRLVAYMCDWDGIRVELVQRELATEDDLALIAARAPANA